MGGARVAATCSPRNADYVRSMGADHAIDYTSGDVCGAVQAWAPEGVDVVVDTVGQGTFTGIVPAMKRGGIVAAIGTLIANESVIDPAEAIAAGVTVVPTISNFSHQPRQLAALVDWLASGRIRAPDYEVLDLAAAGEAHKRIQQSHVRGKLLLEVNASLGK
jgi:NADPH:quinone reductase-like Zn-dependent oxidoreductase